MRHRFVANEPDEGRRCIDCDCREFSTAAKLPCFDEGLIDYRNLDPLHLMIDAEQNRYEDFMRGMAP